MRKYCLQIVFIPINFSFIHRLGFWLIIKGNILEFCLYNHARWWLDRYSKVWNRIHSGGFLSLSSYVMVFLYTPSNTWQKIYAHNQFPGALVISFAEVNRQNPTPCSGDTTVCFSWRFKSTYPIVSMHPSKVLCFVLVDSISGRICFR